MAQLEGSGTYTMGGEPIPVASVYDLQGAYVANRPPHRHLIAPTPWGGVIRRGMIQAHADFAGLPNGAFFFHFNPERINVNYSRTGVDMFAAQEAAESGLEPGMLEGAYSIGFVILLNRQYDAAESQESRGTLEDVDTLLAILGYGDYIVDRPVRVIFSPQFSFNGFVTNLSVTHHQFAARMVPVWTTIDISLTNIPGGMTLAGGQGGFGGYGGTSAQPQNTPGATSGLSPNSGRLE